MYFSIIVFLESSIFFLELVCESRNKNKVLVCSLIKSHVFLLFCRKPLIVQNMEMDLAQKMNGP